MSSEQRGLERARRDLAVRHAAGLRRLAGAAAVVLALALGGPVAGSIATSADPLGPAADPSFTFAWAMGDRGALVASASTLPVWVSARALQTFEPAGNGSVAFTSHVRLPASGFRAVADGSTVYAHSSRPGLVAADISNPERPSLQDLTTDSTLSGRELKLVRAPWFFFVRSTSIEADERGQLVSPAWISIARRDANGHVAWLGDVRLDLLWTESLRGLEFDGTRYLYALSSGGELQVVDLVDPAAPRAIVRLRPPTAQARTATASGQAMWVHRGALLTTDGRYLYSWSLADPAAPRLMDTLDVGCQTSDVAIDGDLAWLLRNACDTDLAAVDLAVPARPRLLGAWRSTPTGYMGSQDLGLAGSLALIDRGTDGLVMVELSPTSGPDPVAAWPGLPLGAERVVAGDGIALVISSSGLLILDTGDPSKPLAGGRLLLPNVLNPSGQSAASQPAAAAFTDGGILVAAASPYLHVFENAIDQPARLRATLPLTVGTMPARCTRLSVSGGRAAALCQPLSPTWQATGTAVAALFDVSGLPDGLPPGTVVPATAPEDVAMAGTRMLVADGAAGLRVIDATNATAPVLRATVPISGSAKAVVSDGSVAYLATGAAGGLETVALDEAVPSRMAAVATSGNASALTIAGGYTFVADPPVGLVAFDVRNPRAPAPVALAALAGDADKVTVLAGDHVLAGSSGGLFTAFRFSGLPALPLPTASPTQAPAVTPRSWPDPWIYLPFTMRTGVSGNITRPSRGDREAAAGLAALRLPHPRLRLAGPGRQADQRADEPLLRSLPAGPRPSR